MDIWDWVLRAGRFEGFCGDMVSDNIFAAHQHMMGWVNANHLITLPYWDKTLNVNESHGTLPQDSWRGLCICASRENVLCVYTLKSIKRFVPKHHSVKVVLLIYRSIYLWHSPARMLPLLFVDNTHKGCFTQHPPPQVYRETLCPNDMHILIWHSISTRIFFFLIVCQMFHYKIH